MPSGQQPGSDREEHSGQRGYRTHLEDHITEIAAGVHDAVQRRDGVGGGEHVVDVDRPITQPEEANIREGEHSSGEEHELKTQIAREKNAQNLVTFIIVQSSIPNGKKNSYYVFTPEAHCNITFYQWFSL